MRFRAPEAINEVAKELAKKHPNVEFVNIKKALENYTRDNIIGNELLLEHVHPNLRGHFLISSALIESFRQASFLYDQSLTQKPLIGFQDLPLTEVDSLTGLYSNWLLREGWPFNEQIPADEKKEKTLEEAVAGSLSVRTIKAEVFKDGINADKAACDYKKEVIQINSDKKFKISMAPGGGCAIKITGI